MATETVETNVMTPSTIRDVALTTTDNPYDYFTHYDEWLAYELSTGSRCFYNLALFGHASPFLSYAEYMNDIEQTIDEIIEYDVTNTFKKVVNNVKS